MTDHHEPTSPKGRLSRRAILLIAGAVLVVIVGFFIVMSTLTLSTTPTPDETPRDATVSPTSSTSP